jgi:hypothetical protein
VAQLAGLALGISLEHLALARHVVDCQNILAHIGYGSGQAYAESIRSDASRGIPPPV